MINYEDFEKIQIITGTILKAEYIKDAKYSTHKLEIDFGIKVGIKKSCARLIKYKLDELIGKQIIAVVNFPPKQIGKNLSEVLVLGTPDSNGDCVLLSMDKKVANGVSVF